MRFEVYLYEKIDGNCPIEEFLANVDIKMREKLF